MAVCEARARPALRRSSRTLKGPGSVDLQRATNARIKALIAEARFGSRYDNNSSSGGSSPTSSAHSDDSDDSSSADEFSDDVRRCHRRHGSPLASSSARDRPIPFPSVSSPTCAALGDDTRHRNLMLVVLPNFCLPAVAAARSKALAFWLDGFDVGWVVGGGGGTSESLPLPRREVARRVGAWAEALRAMERVFRLHKPELLRVSEKEAAALGELAAASAGAMLKLVRDVSALKSSPFKLLAALDVYVPAWETYPVLARLFSWPPSHPVLAAAEAALADLVNAARGCCRRDLRAFVRAYYPWRMPPGAGDGEVIHPCVGFWMGYFRCMLRNRIPLYFILGNDGNPEDSRRAVISSQPLLPARAVSAEGTASGGSLSHLVAELISCLEAVLEDKSSSSSSAAVPGLRQVFMLNNTCAIMLQAMGSDLRPFLPPEWLRVREERMEGYIKGYMDAAWAPVVSRLELDSTPSIIVPRRRDPLDAFCSALESACSEQRQWKVPNPVLRGILRKVVTESVVPMYRRFLEDHREAARAVPTRLTAEELEHQLSNLFEG
ncbi:hypothetical protein PR202_gb27646 [Eleusine coracana subsp. coracana]|uniref:Exocyst subunit Exo70 family protein n=1 Tax=Eleusine coracana subsp. coracana TaxID=191504 RepID=A0AAV5FSG2_ELECO|nr:hypothetical protein PR202_gb27646 [Eleusine coracana subsp. coracana]